MRIYYERCPAQVFDRYKSNSILMQNYKHYHHSSSTKMETVNAFGSGIVKTMAAGIGFVSEGASSYKEKKLEKYSSDKGSIGKAVRMLRPPSQQQSPYFEANNSKTWALDEAQEKVAPITAPLKTKKELKERDTNKIIASFILRNPAPKQEDATSRMTERLPLPVSM